MRYVLHVLCYVLHVKGYMVYVMCSVQHVMCSYASRLRGLRVLLHLNNLTNVVDGMQEITHDNKCSYRVAQRKQ